MANEFFTILTAAGRNKLAAATATATPLALTQMAVGDGDPATLGGAYYSPTEAQTALKHEVWRGAINHLAVDANNPNWIVAELVIPDDVGGFYIREVGLFDSTGAMIAVGKFPESYKPTLAAGSNKQLYVRMILEVSNTTAVTLLVDPSVVLATRQYVDDKVAIEINKLDGKQSARVATTGAIALTGLQTIDGVVLAPGDRVLVKDQAAGTENGIYAVAASVWPRAKDADAAGEMTPGMAVAIEQGTANADTVWLLVTDGPITLGVTSLSFDWVGRRGLAPLASPGFSGSPTAPTPPQFDSSTRLVNTAFLKKAGLQHSGVNGVSASTALTTEHAGSLVVAYGNNGPITITLPLINTYSSGATISFLNASAYAVTVSRQGADQINPAANVVNSVLLQPGDTLCLSVFGGVWEAFDGTARLQYFNPVAITQAQFDNGPRVATTEFVQISGHKYSQIAQFAAGPVALNAAHCGKLIDLASAYTGAVTLPAAAGLVDGSVIHIWSGSNVDVLVGRAGADVIYVNNGAPVNQVNLKPGDTIVLARFGASAWVAIGGSAQLQYSGVMKSSAGMAVNGYRYLPAYPGDPTPMIFQWGTAGTVAAGGALTINFNIAFPNNMFCASPGNSFISGSTGTTSTIGVKYNGLANFIAYAVGASGQPNVPWIAIGN